MLKRISQQLNIFSALFHSIGQWTEIIAAGHRKAHAGGEQAAHMHMRQTRRRQHRVVDVVVGAKAGARRRQRARQGGESRTITTWRVKTRTRIVGEAAGLGAVPVPLTKPSPRAVDESRDAKGMDGIGSRDPTGMDGMETSHTKIRPGARITQGNEGLSVT